MVHRPCSWPKCGRYAEVGSRCRVHASQYRKQTRSPNDSFYSTRRWRLTRRAFLADHPLCQYEGCDNLAEHVHHVIDIQDGGDRFDPDNLAALCASCHSRITLARQRASPSAGIEI